jgi:hypothetical protein
MDLRGRQRLSPASRGLPALLARTFSAAIRGSTTLSTTLVKTQYRARLCASPVDFAAMTNLVHLYGPAGVIHG